MTSLPENLQRFNRWLLFGMLALLHLALWLGVQNTLTQALLFVHLGLFLLWQPVWRGERELPVGGIVSIVCASAVALWWLNWWLLAFWVSGLFALVGGRVFGAHTRWVRLWYLTVMSYLLMVQLIWIVPHLFAPQAITETTLDMMQWVLPVWLAGAALMPAEAKQAETGRTVDFLYSLLLFLLLILLVLGSLSFMTIEKVEYFEALLRTLFSMALVLFVLGWLWNPRFGFGGLQSLLSRYLLNVGTPFESWFRQMEEASRHELAPQNFLAQAAAHLAAVPWVSGVAWRTSAGTGSLGAASRHSVDIREGGLHLTLYSDQRISPALSLHIHLLTRLLIHFYQAKQREQRLREMARLQAIHETGARLTHDLKNTLQSLFGLISIAQRDRETSIPALQRQLPLLAQRIGLTLSKLKAPQREEDAALLPLVAWWEHLRLRHDHDGLVWLCTDEPGETPIPAALFDSVADNLIDNALAKRQRQPGIAVRVSLRAEPLRLAVCDEGGAIPAHLAEQLLHAIVPSENGLGVGLYQIARWAEQLGYRLALRENRDGRVCFELAETDREAGR
jgi:signal transduction histidine kinase